MFTTNINRRYLAETRREPTYTDVGNADIAGAYICHPWRLNTRSRPPRTVEVQVLQEQKPAMRLTVSARYLQSMSLDIICGTAVPYSPITFAPSMDGKMYS
ncbi:MAG: hypothetical protein QNL03_04140, partial [Gammaproteobacteria bacterium]|nr:hypothetical protein [Gammaproteobacteria bacterium]